MLTLKTYHNAFSEVVEDGGFEREHLPTDDGVGQGETDKKWLEGGQSGTRRHAEAHGGDAESSRNPLCDGVRNSLLHVHRAAVSAQTQGSRM